MFTYLTSRDAVKDHVALMSKEAFCVVDVETTSLDWRVAKLVEVQLSCVDPEDAVMFPAEFADELDNLRTVWVCHNFKYDYKILFRHGISVKDKTFRDTFLLSHLHNENGRHGLGAVLDKLNLADGGYKDDFWTTYDTYLDAPLEVRLEYGCKDIIYTRMIYESLAVRR